MAHFYSAIASLADSLSRSSESREVQIALKGPNSSLLSSFHVPSGTDITFAQHQIEILDALVHSGGREPVDGPRYIQIKTAIEQWKCVIAPIRQIPNEILGHIFSSLDIELIDGITTPYREFSLVSKKWHSFIQDHPELWTSISLNLRAPVNSRVLSACLSYSKRLPVQISLHTYDRIYPSPIRVDENIVSAIVNSRQRWNEIAVYASDIQTLKTLGILGVRLPSLKCLVVHASAYQGPRDFLGQFGPIPVTPPDLKDLVIGDLPSCTEVQIVGTVGLTRILPLDSPVLSQITVLELSVRDLEVVQLPVVADYLSRMPNLTEIKVIPQDHHHCYLYHDSSDPATQRDIRTMTRTIHLPRLTYLGFPFGRIAFLLPHIRAPNLSTLVFEFPRIQWADWHRRGLLIVRDFVRAQREHYGDRFNVSRLEMWGIPRNFLVPHIIELFLVLPSLPSLPLYEPRFPCGTYTQLIPILSARSDILPSLNHFEIVTADEDDVPGRADEVRETLRELQFHLTRPGLRLVYQRFTIHPPV